MSVTWERKWDEDDWDEDDDYNERKKPKNKSDYQDWSEIDYARRYRESRD